MAASSTTSSDAQDLEKQPPSAPPTHRLRLTAHLFIPVPASGPTSLLLLTLTLLTGIQDATTFPDYHCFASNQTGNTIFLTLAVVLPSLNGDMFVTANIATALAAFLLASWLTGQLANLLSCHRTRLFLVCCNILQSLLVSAAAVLQFRYAIALSSPSSLAVIALLAFASGSQVVQSRALATPEISTAMATAAWVDLVIDPHLFRIHGTNTGRNRRVGFLLALVMGGFVGAAIYRYAGSATAILVSAVGKLVVGVAYFFVPGEKEEGMVEEKGERGATRGSDGKVAAI